MFFRPSILESHARPGTAPSLAKPYMSRMLARKYPKQAEAAGARTIIIRINVTALFCVASRYTAPTIEGNLDAKSGS